MRLLIGLGLYSLFTGGISIHDTTNFDNPIQMDSKNPALTRIHVQPEKAKLSVPLLFHYTGNQRPYALVMQMFSKKKDIELLEVNLVKIEYEDGTVIKSMKNWKRGFKESDWYGGPEYFEIHYLSLDRKMDSLVLFRPYFPILDL